MRMRELNTLPTEYCDNSGQKCHESCLRSYHLLNKVKQMLEQQTPPQVIMEYIMDADDYLLQTNQT